MANIEFIAAPKEIEFLDEACYWAMVCVGSHLDEIKGVRDFDERDLDLLELMVEWEKLSKKLSKARQNSKEICHTATNKRVTKRSSVAGKRTAS